MRRSPRSLSVLVTALGFQALPAQAASPQATPTPAATLDRTQPGIFSVDDAADVGMDEGTPVVEDYQPRSTKFKGTIRKVIVDVKAIGAADQADVKKADAETKKKIEEAK